MPSERIPFVPSKLLSVTVFTIAMEGTLKQQLRTRRINEHKNWIMEVTATTNISEHCSGCVHTARSSSRDPRGSLCEAALSVSAWQIRNYIYQRQITHQQSQRVLRKAKCLDVYLHLIIYPHISLYAYTVSTL